MNIVLSRQFWFRIAVCTLLGVLVSACSSIRYYSHLAQGQWSLLSQRQSITALLQQEDIEPQLRERLTQVLAARQFASDELALADNNSYRYYTDLKRPYAVWNVFAAPEFSVTPVNWCFPLAGCVSYRGYFSKAPAQAFADKLAREGKDTYVGGVAAYSTLGWFDDPVLNTFLYSHETRLVGLIFHELAHQRIYVPGDTDFNESFASSVEIAGLKRWLQQSNAQTDINQYLQQRRLRSDFVAIILTLRKELETLYQQDLPTQDKRSNKQQIIKTFQQQHYQRFKVRWNGYSGYDYWVTGKHSSDNQEPNTEAKLPALNNAKLSTIASYNQWLPAFEQLLFDEDGDFTKFYQRVEAFTKLDKEQRTTALEQLMLRAKMTAN